MSVGTDQDTSAFAMQTILTWWLSVGKEHYPGATQLVIAALGCGSNGHRLRLWKLELSRLAQKVRAELDTAQYPKGFVISDAELATMKIERHEFRGDWN